MSLPCKGGSDYEAVRGGFFASKPAHQLSACSLASRRPARSLESGMGSTLNYFTAQVAIGGAASL
jgi:hypothetical protein